MILPNLPPAYRYDFYRDSWMNRNTQKLNPVASLSATIPAIAKVSGQRVRRPL